MEEGAAESYGDFIYPGDTTSRAAADSGERLNEQAQHQYKSAREVMAQFGLKKNQSKTTNIVFSPRFSPRGVYCRSPASQCPATWTRVLKRCRMEARPLRKRPEIDPFVEDGKGGAPEAAPVPITETIRIPGVPFDQHPTLGEDFANITRRAQVQEGASARVARMKWVLETGVSRNAVVAMRWSRACCGMGWFSRVVVFPWAG